MSSTLFAAVSSRFATSALDLEKWQILMIASVTAGGKPHLAAELYTYLIALPQYESTEARQALVRRLREALVKLVPIIGVVRPLEAIFQIVEVERPEDRDLSFSRENWRSGEDNIRRGKNWLDQIYRHNITSTENKLSAHKDFMWISEEITYGLYLSDHTILDGIDTELIVLSGLVMQNAPREVAWHLRGARRIGLSATDVETVHQCIEVVADFCGLDVRELPRVKDIEHEVASA